jgi:hypothetical protein
VREITGFNKTFIKKLDKLKENTWQIKVVVIL